MSQNLVVVQQYLSWKGHYRQYFENLHDSRYQYLYASNKPEDYENAKWIKSDFNSDQPLTIMSKIKGRFLDSFYVYKELGRGDFDIIHLIEFEPLTYLFLVGRFKKPHRLILTIHSSDRLYFNSWVNNKLSGFQRWLLEVALRKAVSGGAHIVTHYECHRDSILEIVGDKYSHRVNVIQYPAPHPESDLVKIPKDLSSPRYLIYGQIREDKGIYEFLKNESTKRMDITIAGKIVDKRIFEFSERANLTIIDKFLSDEEISYLVDSHDFMLLPYPLAYTNGAGTFKDSLAKAMPVVCSNISIFNEIIGTHKVGLIFEDPDNIERIVKSVSADDYRKMSQNCIDYANQYNWQYMRNSYFSIYNKLLESN
jgi:glycosyltransferase involved in cell wall biosynthesis